MSNTFAYELKVLDPRALNLNGEGTLPEYAHEGDSGFSLRCLEDFTVRSGERHLVKMGYAVALPVGKELQVRPRSGNAAKKGITVLNAPGTIDASYRGEIMVLVINHDAADQEFKAGDGVAQGVFADVYVGKHAIVEELSETVRGTGGFGSTGESGTLANNQVKLPFVRIV
jgi:dUTP pyrophosphatase